MPLMSGPFEIRAWYLVETQKFLESVEFLIISSNLIKFSPKTLGGGERVPLSTHTALWQAN